MLIFERSDGLDESGSIVLTAVLPFVILSAKLLAKFFLYPKIRAQILDDRIGYVFAKIRKEFCGEVDV